MQKTIKAKVCEQTNDSKLQILDREIERWNDILHEIFEEGKTEYDDVKAEERHSCYTSLATFKQDQLSVNEPMIVKNSFLKIERRDTALVPYWVSIPTKERRGGVWLPIEMPRKYYGFEEEWEIRDSKVTKEDGDYYVHICIEKEVEPASEYNGVLGVDLGVRYVAVTWNSVREKPRFHGKELREIRGKYHYLRRKLQSEKKIEAIQNIKNREHRKVDHELHQISRKIVDQAKEDDLAIFIGDLSGHRDSDFGRKGNRQLHSAPTYQLKKQIKYKAQEAGVLCKEIDESYTTVTCSDCGYERSSRPGKEFICPECGYQVQSDVNGAKNLSKRGFGYISKSGAIAVSPNPANNDPIDQLPDDRENEAKRSQ